MNGVTMNYKEARAFINDSNQYGSKLGLVTITELMRRLDNPQDKLKIIHVAGTNGKGSTTAMIASVLAAEGYHVGRYISPAVFSYQERIQLSRKNEFHQVVNENITKEGICDAIAKIKPACEAMVAEGFHHPTSFEIETAMAVLHMNKINVDFAILEVGLGGRLDATNVILHPICCVITSISMDHMQFLGDTLEKIAREKAGIIKPGVPVITCNNEPSILRVLKDTCEEKNSQLTVRSEEDLTHMEYSLEGTSFSYHDHDYVIKMLGEYQGKNALLALGTIEVLQSLGYQISQAAIQEGLVQAKWNGRFEILAEKPYFIIDGAHNEDAALHLKKTLQHYFSKYKLIYIVGVLADKDYGKILELMAPLAYQIITVTPGNERALASSQLAIEAKKYCNCSVIDAQTVPNAINIAYDSADKEDVILAFGSLSYLSEVKAEVKDALVRRSRSR
jgi:dihydrofolate synthase / folylpolyglutamate synthase